MTSRPSIARFISENVSEELHLVLRGHLFLEAMLDEILKRSVQNPHALSARSGFYQKVKLCHALGRLDHETEKALLAINQVRNKIAHQLNFVITFENAFALVKEVAECGIDFSDDTIHQDLELSKEWYGTVGVLSEVMTNCMFHVLYMNEDLAGVLEMS